MGKKYDIFISYRRAGGIESAVALQTTLRNMHYRVFLDVDNLRSGRFDEALLRRIEECRDFLLVLSPGALDRCVNEGDWVRREIEHAMSLGKNIIPIICDGGATAERMKADLPPSLADLPQYNVLETNVVQLHAMTQLLRTNLASKPHSPVKPLLTGAAIAAVVCVLAFFGAGILKNYLSVFPRTAKEKNLVEQAIAQQSMNLVKYNAAHAAYLKALDDCRLYLSGSPQMSRSNLSLTMNYAMDAIQEQADALADIDPQVVQGLTGSPLNVADLGAQVTYLDQCLDGMFSILLYLEYEFLDDPYTTAASKELWVGCYRDLAALEGDTMILGLNELFLPVSDEALRDLRTISLPVMTSIYAGQVWLTSADDLTAQAESIARQQAEIMARFDSDLLKGQAMLENEKKLQEIRTQVAAQRLADTRALLEQKKKELEEAKARLYETHKPLATDEAYILFSKGLMFTKHNMMDAALESFALYRLSNDPNAAIVGDAAARFVINRDLTGVHTGVIVVMYEEGKTPQPSIQIGDIIYAVNGKEVSYVDEYTAAKAGNAASTVSVLRFTDAGYERLNLQLDAQAGLMYLYSLEYE